MISDRKTKAELVGNLEELIEDHEEKVNSADCLEIGEFKELYLRLYEEVKSACGYKTEVYE